MYYLKDWNSGFVCFWRKTENIFGRQEKPSLSHVKQKKKFVNHFLSFNFSFSTNNTRLLSCMHSFAICSPSLSKVAVVDILYEPNAKYKPNVENIFIWNYFLTLKLVRMSIPFFGWAWRIRWQASGVSWHYTLVHSMLYGSRVLAVCVCGRENESPTVHIHIIVIVQKIQIIGETMLRTLSLSQRGKLYLR